MYFISAKLVRKLSYVAEIKKNKQTKCAVKENNKDLHFFSLLRSRSKNKTKSYFPSRTAKTLWSGTRGFFNQTRVFKSTRPNFLFDLFEFQSSSVVTQTVLATK